MTNQVKALQLRLVLCMFNFPFEDLIATVLVAFVSGLLPERRHEFGWKKIIQNKEWKVAE